MKSNRNLKVILLILLAAACVRVIRYRAWPGECMGSTSDTNEMARIAQSIAATGQFANPYSVPTGPTAHHAPVFPFLLSFVYRLPAEWRTSARIGANILFGSVLCASVYLAGIALGLSTAASFLTAMLLALVPASLSVELCNDQEATMVGAFVVAVSAATAAWLRLSFKRYWVLGLMWGVVLLAAPGLLPVYAGCLLIGMTVPELRPKIPIVILVSAIIVAPWIVRNRLVLGGWFFIRDNAGLELRVSNADSALNDPSRNAERGAMQDYHPLFNPAIAARVRREGELAVYSRMGHDAVEWMIAHPSRFLALTADRFKYFWWPVEKSWKQLMGRTAALILAAAGLVLLWKREKRSALLLVDLFLLYPFAYYFVQSYPRYRFPIEWAVILLAIHALCELESIVRRHREVTARAVAAC